MIFYDFLNVFSNFGSDPYLTFGVKGHLKFSIFLWGYIASKIFLAPWFFMIFWMYFRIWPPEIWPLGSKVTWICSAYFCEATCTIKIILAPSLDFLWFFEYISNLTRKWPLKFDLWGQRPPVFVQHIFVSLHVQVK